jgi:hypothetical protein
MLMVHHSESSFVKICIKNTDILRAFVSNLIGTKNKWPYQTCDFLRGSIDMKFSMIGQEGDLLIEVAAWAGLTVHTSSSG